MRWVDLVILLGSGGLGCWLLQLCLLTVLFVLFWCLAGDGVCGLGCGVRCEFWVVAGCYGCLFAVCGYLVLGFGF